MPTRLNAVNKHTYGLLWHLFNSVFKIIKTTILGVLLYRAPCNFDYLLQSIKRARGQGLSGHRMRITAYVPSGARTGQIHPPNSVFAGSVCCLGNLISSLANLEHC